MAAQTRGKTPLGIIAAIVVAILWLILFFSNRGILVWFSEPPEKVGMLKCHYFTGTKIVDRQFLFSRQGFLGRESCPRSVDLK